VRVQLSRARDRDARGSIAIMTGISVGALCLIAAFALDFGMAYNSKQRLQIAADAGALAAVQVYKGQTGQCSSFVGNTALKAAAQTAADRWAQLNRPGAVGTPIGVECVGTSALKVSYGTSGSTVVTLGQLAVDNETITTNRAAAATIGNATISVGPMRPWGICSNVATTTGEVVFAPLEGGKTVQDGANVCGGNGPPGGWWVMQCTGQSNANGVTESIVTTGCPTNGYSAVTGQPTSGTASQLFNHLTATCPSKTANNSCIQSDPGSNFHNAADEWQPQVGEVFTMPGFCTPPQCTATAVDGGGNNASYAIHRMITVELCGYKIGSYASTGWPTTGPCATKNPKNYKSSDVSAGSGFFVVVRGINGGSANWTLNTYEAPTLSE
jgi:Flp pilus assembly protein TadG